MAHRDPWKNSKLSNILTTGKLQETNGLRPKIPDDVRKGRLEHGDWRQEVATALGVGPVVESNHEKLSEVEEKKATELEGTGRTCITARN